MLVMRAAGKGVASQSAPAYPIVKLTETGSERFTPEQVIAYTGLKVDKQRPVSLEDVKLAAQRLAASGVFKEVRYTHRGMAAGPGVLGIAVDFIVEDQSDNVF